MKLKILAGLALLALPLLLMTVKHKDARTGPSDFRDAPASGAADELRKISPLRTDPEAAEPRPGALRSRAAASNTLGGNTAEEIAWRCSPAAAGDPIIKMKDFQWNYTLPEILSRFKEMYASPKRLNSRAYWDETTKSIRLPYLKDRGGDIEIDPSFVQAVERQIERAIELKYADAVFFPDMGHSHLLIPDELWKAKYALYPVKRISFMYRDLFRDPQVKIFYHTAEQLKMREADGELVNDERTRFRHKTRNISGSITADTDLALHQNPESRVNTVNEVPGYFWYSGGFNVSAQKDGCFVYHAGGRTYRFDLSMFDLPEDPEEGYKSGETAGKSPATLRYSPECILKSVAQMMGQKYRPDIPMPKIFLESDITLDQFQDAVEEQWGQRPDNITNVYVWKRNEIYLLDDPVYYASYKRAIDDSLAHEFVHYIQDRYRGWDLSTDDPAFEPQAVEFQTMFRENFINKPGVCPS